jgi:Family of unknown function (DUF5681)
MAKFKPGQSGNPGGRPKMIPELRALCRNHTAQVVERWVEILNDKKAQHRDVINAGDKLMLYGYGRPVNANEMNLLINNSARNDDGGEVRVLVAFGAKGEPGELDLGAYAARATEQPRRPEPRPDVKLVEDLRPGKVTKSLTEKQADLDRLNLEISRLRAVLEGRAADWDESGWNHDLPPSSGSDWPGRTR